MIYPKNPALDSVNCLASLVGVRSSCSPGEQRHIWLEDIEGLDVQKLAKIAKGANFKGENLGRWIIDSAAREMMGDIELLLNNGYSMKSMVGAICSSCTFLSTYAANTGVIVKTAVASSFQQLVIDKLEILANVTGSKQFCIDDGVEPKFWTVDLVAGVQQPVNLIYRTFEKKVKIYFTDATVPLGLISCPTNSGCGCGKTSADATAPVVIKGLLAGNEAVSQYGFIVCAGVACSYDTMVCSMINKTPRIFALVLHYKIGDKYLITKNQSDRNNDIASYNDDQDVEIQKNYGQLYWAKLKGTGNMKGLKNIINDYLKTISYDQCVECQTKIYSASAVG